MSFVDELPSELKSEIIRISEESDGALKVFEQLYTFLTDTKRRKTNSNTNGNEDDVDDYYQIDKINPQTIIFQLKDLSFQSPIRKKMNLTFSISPVTQKPILSIGKSNDEKPELIIGELSKDNIRFSTFLPVPEKKNQSYFILFYQKNIGETHQNDPIVLTMNNDQVSKQLISESLIKEGEDFRNYIIRQAAVSGFKIQETFTPRSGSFFVQAHKGTKEGILYFLPNQILFGFKKPVLLFDTKDIESYNYSSITRITFNVTLVLKSGEKHEFSMIDQNEYSNIDPYIKNKELLDNSMSEELKAKKLTKNQDATGALEEATQQVGDIMEEVGEQDDSDDEDADANFTVGAEVDDTSDVSGPDDDDDDDDEEEEEEEGEEDGDEEIELNSDDD